MGTGSAASGVKQITYKALQCTWRWYLWRL